MFGKMFKSAKKVQNENIMQAIIAASLLVAAADGEIEKSETDKLQKLLQNNELLSAFAPAEISKTVTKYAGILDADFNVGKLKMLKEIRDIAGNPEQSEEVFVTALAIANSDGEIEPEELKVLTQLGRELGVNLSEYGIA